MRVTCCSFCVAYYSPLTAYYLTLTTYYLPITTRYLLLATCCLLLTSYLLFMTHCLLLITYPLLLVTRHLKFSLLIAHYLNDGQQRRPEHGLVIMSGRRTLGLRKPPRVLLAGDHSDTLGLLRLVEAEGQHGRYLKSRLPQARYARGNFCDISNCSVRGAWYLVLGNRY